MPQLKVKGVGQAAVLTWDPTDFLECFGVLPTEEEHDISHSYARAKDGMRWLSVSCSTMETST